MRRRRRMCEEPTLERVRDQAIRARALARAVVAAALLFGACGARSELDVIPPSDAIERCDGLDDDGDARIDEGLPLEIVSEPIRVRTDEGSAGACARCRWALSALAPTREGMVLLARLYDEGEPDFNLMRRRLEARGRPLERWDLSLGEQSSDWFPSISRSRDADGRVDGIALGTSTREGAESLRPMITILDADGVRVAGPTPIPIARAVRRWGTPQITRLEDGAFLSALECSSDVCLAAIDEDGTTRESWALGDRSALLPPSGVLGISAPVLAHHAGLVGVATIQVHAGPPVRPELLFFLLAPDGATLRESRVELPLPDFEHVPIDTLRIVAGDEGFLVLFLRRDSCPVDGRRGRWIARFDRDGVLVEGPTISEPEWCFFGADLALEPRAGGGWWLSGTRKLERTEGIDGQESFVAELDARGSLRWASALDVWLHSLVELDDGSVVAAVSTRWEHDQPNAIDIVRLRCAP
ncbi:MAG: hypothetical protein M3Y87_22115 [Myxococcota bacterium]|nr:hypothetical protein [Myxococcota bacterium]